MENAKISLKIGAVELSAEGEQSWVATQLDTVLKKSPELLRLAPPDTKPDFRDTEGLGGGGKGPAGPNMTLAAFLKECKATSQENRFLATAAWLIQKKGHKLLTTHDVSSEISAHHQGKLANPSKSLARNDTRGFCVKEGKQFYVSPEGYKHLGLPSE